ncbi:MAG: phosphomannomutase/phosphoglucomutase [Anaerolineae bacterium]|nr:phosphomannomutase/phosphoglucomutase [Thermoflexales bacterium]MDW8407790.1 phosphomannomutase/phosphoglucomutase [Anaerolineae bacterium]
MSIFKACDIRGRYGHELFDSHGERLGLALAEEFAPGEVIVGGDGRLSTPALKQALIGGLLRGGCSVVDIGLVPTPAFYFARSYLGILPGVMVTASHNPAEDNGFKVALSELPATPQDIQSLAARMESEDLRAAKQPGALCAVDVLPAYIAHVRAHTPDLGGLRVVVDCANGATALTARAVWQASGAQAIFLHDTVDGAFPNHPPDPSVFKNLKFVSRAVIEQQADLGVGYDGDGDRAVFVDGKGRPLPADKTIVLFARCALANGPAPIVYDQKCSLLVPETIRAHGGQPVMERSGHTFIKTTFLRLGAPYAGEISGHHFFREIGGDDGLIASLRMADLVRQSGKRLAHLADDIPTYPITPDIRLYMEPATVSQVLDSLAEQLSNEARLSTLDGLRVEYADGWGLARQSVTESAITLRFEGKTEQALRRIMARFEAAAPALAGHLIEHQPLRTDKPA